MTPPRTVLVVGAGLIGTSVGLALCRRGVAVALEDSDPGHLRVAASVGAGTPGPPGADPDLVVVAVPPALAGDVSAAALRRFPQAYVTDLASTKQAALVRVRESASGDAVARYVGSHPMAGSERSGPLAAQADLFDGRTWAVTGHPDAAPAAVATVDGLARLCGAVPVHLTPAAHDEAVALVSHLPQVAASVVAGLLAAASDDDLSLAGQGLRDVTRIAASDPDLWSQILAVNARPVARLLRDAAGTMERFAAVLDGIGAAHPDGQRNGDASGAGEADGSAELRDLLGRGVAGVRRLPGKHGRTAEPYAAVPVVVPDRPGSLAGLFSEADAAGINIEDVRIDHSPGVPAGLVELFVRPGDEARLLDALGRHGWVVHR